MIAFFTGLGPAILVGILFGIPMLAVVAIAGWTIVNTWTAPWFAPDTIFFNGDDIKIFILIGVCILSYVAYRMFGPMKSEGASISVWGQIGLATSVTSLVGLVVLIGEDTYLERAMTFAEAAEYQVCDLDRMRYFKELKMSRSASGCDAQSPLDNAFSAAFDFLFS